MNGAIRPILLLEINEVPWKLIDRFIDDPRYPAIREFFRDSMALTNVAVDAGELSPWITWPTFHRGCTMQEHRIRNLGQDPMSFRGTPIWQEYRRRGLPIGIFGSLQSWPPLVPGDGGFYIPDTFAHDAACIPAALESLQRFNLRQTSLNGRVVSQRSLFSRESLGLLARLPGLGIRLGTLASVARQIAAERVDRSRASRRPIFQSIIMWDAFKSLFNCKNPPMFATFFTNHVAGIMHRYWRDVFPEDFGEKSEEQPRPHLSTMKFAMDVLNRILADVLSFCEVNRKLVVVFATSMGQTAIDRGYRQGLETVLTDVAKLAARLGLPGGSYRPLLAMAPQAAVEIPSPELRRKFIELLGACRTVSGAPLFRVSEILNSVSITLGRPAPRDVEAGLFQVRTEKCAWRDAGIKVYEVDAGTGYHVPEGAMAVYGASVDPDSSRQRLPADQAKSFMLELAGLCR